MDNHIFSSKRRSFLRTVASMAIATASAPVSSYTLTAGGELERGRFVVDIDDIKMYYEVRGSGPLIIMQNGMWVDTFLNYFAVPFMNALTDYYTVLTFDARGQGKTTLGNGPISYGRFAADTVRLMDKLRIDNAHFIGHSDGGCIQLHLLVDFCDRVKSATLVGTAYSHEAYTEKTRSMFSEWFDQMVRGADLHHPLMQKLHASYRNASPHPERFHEMLKLHRKCYATQPNFSLKQLAAIDRPVLVVDAGRDEHIPSEQFNILADALPRGERVRFADMTHDVVPYVTKIAKATNDFTSRV